MQTKTQKKEKMYLILSFPFCKLKHRKMHLICHFLSADLKPRKMHLILSFSFCKLKHRKMHLILSNSFCRPKKLKNASDSVIFFMATITQKNASSHLCLNINILSSYLSKILEHIYFQVQKYE